MTNILEIEHLTKKIKRDLVLENINIHVKKNTIYGLLGPNGAGKSTTLKIVSGLMEKTSGTIRFNGHEWSRKDLANIGTLIESPALYGNLSAFENLEVITTTLGLPENRIKNVLDFVGLSKVGKKKSKDFSMGMKQRLGIAMAIINEPELLILDEPTNGLDPVGIQELRTLIKGFPDRGITVLISSHILSELELLVDDIGIITNGSVHYEEQFTPNENLEELFLKIVSENSTERR